MAAKGQTRSKTSHRTPAQASTQWAEYGSKHKEAHRKRLAARRMLAKEGAVKTGDGKDVDHKKPLRAGGSNSRANLRVKSAATNRAHGSPAGGRATGRRTRP